ncbi:MAG: DUF1289 domain-containing protein [Alphaproteobacteria bacterium]|nr:DUF1289 domain-containing protein [Alphaproteobacteria bacterium]
MSATSKAVASPCVGICAVSNGYCIGCYRTLPEITRWTVLSEDERRAVLNELPARREAFETDDPRN